MTGSQATVAVVGAGGKMGLRVSNNLDKSDYRILYAENSPKGQEHIRGLGHEVTDTHDGGRAKPTSSSSPFPTSCWARISADIVPKMKQGAVVLTLDPAAAYAGLLTSGDGIAYAVAHPCHPRCSSSERPRRSGPTPSAASPRPRMSSPPSSPATPRRGS